MDVAICRFAFHSTFLPSLQQNSLASSIASFCLRFVSVDEIKLYGILGVSPTNSGGMHRE